MTLPIPKLIAVSLPLLAACGVVPDPPQPAGPVAPPAQRTARSLPARTGPELPVTNAAVMTPVRAVNPLTGVPLSLEAMHWSLEQAHLEEQLQASLLNRRKFELEREHLDLGGPVSPALPPPVGVPPPVSAESVPSPARRPAVTVPVASPAVLHAQDTQRSGLRVLGATAQAGTWCLLVAAGEGVNTLCRGQSSGGHRVDGVSAQGYTVDGHDYALEVPVARIERSPPAMPGPANLAAAENDLPPTVLPIAGTVPADSPSPGFPLPIGPVPSLAGTVTGAGRVLHAAPVPPR